MNACTVDATKNLSDSDSMKVPHFSFDHRRKWHLISGAIVVTIVYCASVLVATWWIGR